VLFTGRIALARIFAGYSLATRDFVAANESVRLSANDTEAHYARALLLKSAGFVGESHTEFERAVALRPHDYVLWLELGIVREELGDQQSAEAALDQAVSLAPYYAFPRWQRGNLLLRTGRYDEAFADLRAAAQSNPDFVPTLIDLAWSFSQSNAKTAQQLAEINTPVMHMTFAVYLARHNRLADALEQFKLAKTAPEDKKRELVAALLEKGGLAEAYGVWSGSSNASSGSPSINDGSFEGPLSLDESGFGWRVQKGLQGVQMSIDAGEPKDATKSLRIEFMGESAPQSALLSQLILVAPNKTYHVTFYARSNKLVTGGLPLVAVTDSTDHQLLGLSPAFAKETTDWQQHTFSFSTKESTRGVILSLQREGCSTAPCPAFGTVWLDGFRLQTISN
jgi:tetratricopeptide (TPR) repeat protein